MIPPLEYASDFAAPRLAASRLAAINAATPPASVAATPSTVWATARRGTMRKAGQQAALDVLSWAQAVEFRALLSAARVPHMWAGQWGRERVRQVAGSTLADGLVFLTFEDWVGWLEGVADVADAVEIYA